MSKTNLIDSNRSLNTSASAMSETNPSTDQPTTQNVASAISPPPTSTPSSLNPVILSQTNTTPVSMVTSETLGSNLEPSVVVLESNQASAAVDMPPMSELPSYTEALKLKKMEIENNDGPIPSTIPPSYYTSTNPNGNYLDETRIVIDPADLRAIHDATHESNLMDQEVGSECMFLSAFMISFFFNWVGFFASVCLLPNAAGKYGALSGLGLSIAKWVTMIKYQTWMTQMNDLQQKLFFWFFIFIGFYLFFRGLVNFMSLKYRPRAQGLYSRRAGDRWLGYIE